MAEVDWLGDATEWIDARLAERGSQRAGPVEAVRTRPWGTVLRAETPRGPVWLKAPGPANLFEVRLYGLLADRAPGHVLRPLGAEPDRGWILLPDGGPSAGERFPDEGQIEVMGTALPRYAELQIALARELPAMLELGVADMRPVAMPARFGEALAEIEPYVIAAGSSEDRAALDAVRAIEPEYGEWCERLAQAPVAASVDHNDLHPFNVIAGAAGGFAEARFYDWGDAVVAHPFASLLAVGFLREADDATARRLRDAYLEPFSDQAPRAELIETAELACRVGKVARALTWRRALGPEPDPAWARGPFESLASLLDDTWLGAA